jgi:hypothetical protein
MNAMQGVDALSRHAPSLSSLASSGVVAEAGVPATLSVYWTDRACALVRSAPMLTGLARTWQKPYVQQYDDAETASGTFASAQSLAAGSPLAIVS